MAQGEKKIQSWRDSAKAYFQRAPSPVRSGHPSGFWGRALSRAAGLSVHVVVGFKRHQCSLRASALTFMTALFLVPLLALAFSMSKGLGLQKAVRAALLERLAAGQQEIIIRLIDYVDRTDVKALGAIGILFLLYIGINVMSSVEHSFNDIWGIRQGRSLQRKFADYLSVILVWPLLLFVATGFNATLSSNAVVDYLLQVRFLSEAVTTLLRLTPLFSIWVGFTFLYLFLPNTRVRFSVGLAAGFLAGTAWQLAQWGYIHFQIGVSRYNAIYGTFASLPIFLVWLKLSWMIVLGGCVLGFLLQHSEVRPLTPAGPLTIATRERLALQVAILATRRFARQEPALDPDELASLLGVALGRLPVRRGGGVQPASRGRHSDGSGSRWGATDARSGPSRFDRPHIALGDSPRWGRAGLRALGFAVYGGRARLARVRERLPGPGLRASQPLCARPLPGSRPRRRAPPSLAKLCLKPTSASP